MVAARCTKTVELSHSSMQSFGLMLPKTNIQVLKAADEISHEPSAIRANTDETRKSKTVKPPPEKYQHKHLLSQGIVRCLSVSSNQNAARMSHPRLGWDRGPKESNTQIAK